MLDVLTQPQDEYRARARRVRHRHRRDPAMKLAALRMLAAATDRDAARNNHAPEVVDADRTNPIREFTTRITRELAAGRTLRYSRRLELLNRAERSGINRFDANLMIAAVQHRSPQALESPASGKSMLLPLGVAALVQTVILAGAWLVFVK